MISIAALVFPLCMVAAAATDLFSMTIPNRIPAGLALVFFALAPLSGMSVAVIGIHALVGVLALGLTFGCFAAGWMGGGDAKLIAASALWFGPTLPLLDYTWNAALFGGVLTLACLGLRALVSPTTGVTFIDRLLGRDTGIPYALALGPAGLVAFAATPWAGLIRAGV